jgi:hypothetical protein
MKWRLRIPLILFVFGAMSGFVQYFNLNLGVAYLLIIGVIIYFLEKTEVNEKRVHFSIGILLILLGLLIDFFVR